MTPHDLFTWHAEAEAAEAVAQAEAERAAAERSARYAPHGEILTRRARLQAATHAALRAEVTLKRLQDEQP